MAACVFVRPLLRAALDEATHRFLAEQPVRLRHCAPDARAGLARVGRTPRPRDAAVVTFSPHASRDGSIGDACPHEKTACLVAPAWPHPGPARRLHRRLAPAPPVRDRSGHRLRQRARRLGAARAHQPHHLARLSRRAAGRPQLARRQPPGALGSARTGGGRAGHRSPGPVRLREDPRPWHPRGAGGDPHRREPHVAEGGRAEAALVGDLDRHRRPVRRRGADHHDRRRLRLAVRAALPPLGSGAEDAARRLAPPLACRRSSPRRWPRCCSRSSCSCSSGSRAASSRWRLAAVAAAALRVPLLGAGPMFPRAHPTPPPLVPSWRLRSAWEWSSGSARRC